MKAKGILLILSTPLIIVLLAWSAFSAEGDSLWSHTYGGSEWDEAYCGTSCGDGGFLLAGVSESFGTNISDIWLLKVNATGDSLWSCTYGDNDYNEAYSIIPSGDGSFLMVGRTSPVSTGSIDILLVKVAANGDFLWSRTYGGSDWDEATSIVPSGDGGFLLAGETGSFGAGNHDMWLVKVNANGDSLWSRTYGGGGGELASSIIPSGDGGFMLIGNTGSFGAGHADIWLVKVNIDGDSLWSRTYGGAGNEWASAIISSSDGGFLLAGGSELGGVLVKVEADGDSLWSQTFGGFGFVDFSSIIPSGDDGYLLVGSVYSGSEDMGLVKVNENGAYLWSNTYGGGSSDRVNSIMLSGDSNYLLVGGTESFGVGSWDMWLLCVQGSGSGAVMPPEQILPRRFYFNSPHPNPFNLSTTLRFELPVASYVTLEVFDVNGRNVGARRCLAPIGGRPSGSPLQTWYSAGSHQITFDGSGLPSGLYFAKLTAGDFTQVQKLVLLK